MESPNIDFLREQLRAAGDFTQIEAVGPLMTGNNLRWLTDKFNGYVDGAVYVRVDSEKDLRPEGHSVDKGFNNVIYWYQGGYGIAYRT